MFANALLGATPRRRVYWQLPYRADSQPEVARGGERIHPMEQQVGRFVNEDCARTRTRWANELLPDKFTAACRGQATLRALSFMLADSGKSFVVFAVTPRRAIRTGRTCPGHGANGSAAPVQTCGRASTKNSQHDEGDVELARVGVVGVFIETSARVAANARAYVVRRDVTGAECRSRPRSIT